VIKRRVRRLVAGAAGVTTVAGMGLLALGVTPAFAGTSTGVYTCAMTGVAPETEAGGIVLTTPDSGATGSTVQVSIDQPQSSTTSPVAITSVAISGTATVSGDGSTTSLAFSGTGGASAAGAAPSAVDTTESLTLSAGGTTTISVPTYTLTVVLSGLGTESGTCTATTTASESITVANQPTASITSVSGQTGTSDARGGSTVSFTGANFSAGAAVSASLVPSGGGTAIALTTTPAAITASAGGAVTGSAAIPSSVAAGAYELTLSDTSGDLPATAPLTILAAPSCTATPSSGGAGTVTTVVCANFDPGAAVTLQGVNSGGAPTGDPTVAATASAAGGVSQNYTVNDGTTAGIDVLESTPESLSAEAAFSAESNSCIADSNGSTGGTCSTSQGTTTTVNPGPLEASQAGAQITLSNITINGTPQLVTGALNQIVVSDFRGSTLGWTVNATATDFTGSNGGTISAARMGVQPSCGPDAAGLAAAGLPAFPSTVTAGPQATFASAVTLCSTPALGAGNVTGGVFDIGGGLGLEVPPYLLAGIYTDTITISLG
jgi:hypothetical protein